MAKRSKFSRDRIIVVSTKKFGEYVPYKNSLISLNGHTLFFSRRATVDDVSLLLINEDDDDANPETLYVVSDRNKPYYNPSWQLWQEIEKKYEDQGSLKILVNTKTGQILFDYNISDYISEEWTPVPPASLKSGQKILGLTFYYNHTTKKNEQKTVIVGMDVENIPGRKFFEYYTERLTVTEAPIIEFGASVMFNFVMDTFNLDKSLPSYGESLMGLANPVMSKEKIFSYNIDELTNFVANFDFKDRDLEITTEPFVLSELIKNPDMVSKYSWKDTYVTLDKKLDLPPGFPKILDIKLNGHFLQVRTKKGDTELDYDTRRAALESALKPIENITTFEIEENLLNNNNDDDFDEEDYLSKWNYGRWE